MRRIEAIYLQSITQLRALRFFKDVYNKMGEIDDERFQIILRSYKYSLDLFHRALKTNPGKKLESKIHAENERCDILWDEFIRKTEQLMNDTDLASRQTGNEVNNIFMDSDDIKRFKGVEKINAINTFLEIVSTKLTYKRLEHAGIADHLSELSRSNWVLKQLIDAHALEVTGKCLTRETLQSRKEVEKAFAIIVEFINAMVIYKGTDRYNRIINDINQLIENVKATPITLDFTVDDHKEDILIEQEAYSA